MFHRTCRITLCVLFGLLCSLGFFLLREPRTPPSLSLFVPGMPRAILLETYGPPQTRTYNGRSLDNYFFYETAADHAPMLRVVEVAYTPTNQIERVFSWRENRHGLVR